MISTIAVGTDGSETAGKAVEFALDMAQRYDAKVIFASAYRPVSESRVRQEQREAPGDVQWSINPREEVDATLSEIEEMAKERGVEFSSEARTGDPADVLCEIAKDAHADLLVVGSKGMQRRVLGSVPNSVSHNAPCSVVIVKTA
ncbi:MAG: universal stress protein [Thermoleophilaceae bacterium]